METKDSDDWIEWFGGQCPVANNIYVDIKFRNGCEYWSQNPGLFWTHSGSPTDIVKYRISKVVDRGWVDASGIVTVTKSKDINKISQRQAVSIKRYKRKIRSKSIEIQMLKEEIHAYRRKIMDLENLISSYKSVHKVYSRSLDFIQDNAVLACALIASEEASPNNAERLRRLIQRDEKAIIQSITDAEMELENGRQLQF